MKNPLKRRQKTTEMAKENKFTGKRQYAVRTGTPPKILVRLNDLYELLHCDPDNDGYVVTTFKEMNELTEMDVNMLTIMVSNGLILKRTTGTSPKFKYKWDTIKPTVDMAAKLVNKRTEMKKRDTPDNVVSESKPESLLPEPEAELSVHTPPNEFDSTTIVDSRVDGDIMTMHVNLTKLGITESAVLNAVLAIDKS